MDIFGVFGIRGRSKEVFRFEDALRGLGLKPEVVSHALKLAAIKLMKEAKERNTFSLEADCSKAAPIICYSILGPEAYMRANGAEALEAAEKRLISAIKLGESLDARLAMLTLLSKAIHPDVIKKFDLKID